LRGVLLSTRRDVETWKNTTLDNASCRRKSNRTHARATWKPTLSNAETFESLAACRRVSLPGTRHGTQRQTKFNVEGRMPGSGVLGYRWLFMLPRLTHAQPTKVKQSLGERLTRMPLLTTAAVWQVTDRLCSRWLSSSCLSNDIENPTCAYPWIDSLGTPGIHRARK
jgi:hypothetical protein